LQIIGSTLSGNQFATHGGALRLTSSSVATLKNATISGTLGGTSASGASQTASGTKLDLIHTTITGNSGGLLLPVGTTTSLGNSIVAGNIGTDVSGVVSTASNSLIGNAAGSHGVTDGANGNLVGVGGVGVRPTGTILNSALGNYGGSTLTHALAPGSLAIDGGSAPLTGDSGLFTDQRGYRRTFGSAPDMGALEDGASSLPTGPGFSLDNLELNRISAGHIQIGATTDGPIQVTEPIDLTTPGTNLTLLAAEPISIEGNTATTGDLLIGSNSGVTTTGDRTLRGRSVTVDADLEARGDLSIVTQGSLDLKKSTAVGLNDLSVTAGGRVDLRRVTGSGIQVTGFPTADTVLLSYVPSRLAINTGAGNDLVSFASASGPVNTTLTSFSRVERLLGSPFMDTLTGSAGRDIFTVTVNNGGTASYPSPTPPLGTRVTLAFTSFEALSGGPGDDAFRFRNQATLTTGVSGDAHINGDTLTIDDRNLTTDETYTIGADFVSRNPFYQFGGIEGLIIETGSGEDRVNTGFWPFAQSVDGNSGEDTLSIPQAINTNSPINQIGSGAVSYADVEKVIGKNGIADTGNILQNEANDATNMAQNNLGDNSDVIDNFSGPGGTAFGTVGGAAAVGIAGQVAQAVSNLPNAGDSPFSPYSVTPFNSGGNFGAISLGGGVISLQGQAEINQSITVGSEMELNEAMGNGALGTADGNDGTVGMTGETGANPGTEQSLGQGTALMAEGELVGALGENLIVIYGDGTVPMGDLSNVPSPGAQQEISNQGSPTSFSNLSQAMGGDGTAPTGPASGPVDLLLTGSAPGQPGTAALSENLNALTENELEGALNGL
jgi:hypothetical protein